MVIWSLNDIKPDPLDMLFRYASGAFPCFLTDDVHGPKGWMKCDYRGVQKLDTIHVPSGQKRYVFSKKWDVHCNRAFEQVVRHCADLQRDGYSWISEDIIGSFVALHQMGFAHSFEAWEGDRLVAGFFGVQLGGVITCESMFHRVDHAGKAAYVRTLLDLKERGFSLVDVNFPAEHFARWGAGWMPQWEFEHAIRRELKRPVSISDEFPARSLPTSVTARLALSRVASAVSNRLSLRRSESAAGAA